MDPYFQSNSSITEGVIVTFNDNYNHSLDQILYLNDYILLIKANAKGLVWIIHDQTFQ